MTSTTEQVRSDRRPQASDVGCRSCGAGEVQVFFARDAVPVHSSLLLPTRQEALDFPRGDLRIGRCDRCGFIQNGAFDRALVHYGPGYEDSQACSSRFTDFAVALADHLISRYGVRHRTVVEVGCGKGDFLDLLCRRGHNRGIGYDPAPDPAEVPATIEHRDEPFTVHTPVEPFDLLVCRHTLEHIDDVAGFVGALAHHLGRHRGSVAYLEVPDVERILHEGAFWDLYYEHCSYFTVATLSDLLERHGLRVLQGRLGFDDQYVQLEVTADRSLPADAQPRPDGGGVAGAVRAFTTQVVDVEQRWRSRIDAWRADGVRVVLWGASSKAVALLTALGLDDHVDAVVDINPRKRGRFLPGSGHEVLAPEQLVERPPDVVVAMNPIYIHEIRDDLASRGLYPEVLAA